MANRKPDENPSTADTHTNLRTPIMAPTSDEEIAAQHADAVRAVEDGHPCAPRREMGEIPLEDKKSPTFSSDTDKGDKHKELQNPICFSTRGNVDVSRIRQLVQEGYNLKYDKENMPPLSPTNYWDPRNAQKNNVSVMRPSHDTWGIGKIVLLFCDDFATKIYQFPWWKDFEESLQPIFEACLPPGANLIRVIMASLPPGVTIPVHHDTGEWVKATHRVHTPILVRDPSRIIFRCGPTPTTMQRIDCSPGHIFEINNQAKHAVSNCGSDSRVNLILDYVQGPTPDRIVLDPGEKLVQTRRSIDRLKDMKQRQTPSYIIIGAQKAGTTSLYDYINQHPWVVKARRRETHCLDWRWNENLKTPQNQLEYCRKFFYSEELKIRPSCLTGDSTPSYLLDSRRVIPRIKRIFDWDMKFFIMMRDPVVRAHSHYAMVTSPEGTPAQLKCRGTEWRGKTFKEVVFAELEKMEECGLIPYWDISQGSFDKTKFDSFAGSKEEEIAFNTYSEKHIPLNTGSYGLITRGMYALQLLPWFKAFDRDRFLLLRLESLKSDGVQTVMNKVWSHLDLPKHTIEDEAPKNTRNYDTMDADMKTYLERFFEPQNGRLKGLLCTDGAEWSSPWPYSTEISEK